MPYYAVTDRALPVPALPNGALADRHDHDKDNNNAQFKAQAKTHRLRTTATTSQQA